MPPAFSRAMGNFGYIVRVETTELIMDAVDFIQSTS